MRLRHRRPGLSLTEVLVALFVMALGLMALLTLFPLGAMQIGQALKDDRTAQTAAQADAWVRVWWRDAVAPPYGIDPTATPGDPLLNALDDANLNNRVFVGNVSGQPVFDNVYAGSTFMLPSVPPAFLQPSTAPAGTPLNPLDLTGDTNVPPTGTAPLTNQTDTATQQFRYSQRPGSGTTTAGYPVLLDMLGSTSTRSGLGALDRTWVGRNGGTVYGQAAGSVPLLLPRRNSVFTPSANAAYAACALTDDLTFQANGASGTGAEPLGRQGRYHWAALIQRPNNAEPDRANLTVLVFDGRPPFLGITGDEVVLTNNFVNTVNPAAPVGRPAFGSATQRLYDGEVEVGSRSLTLYPPTRGADQPPLIRRGGWVAVATLEPGAAGIRTIAFHRVTGLTTGDDLLIGATAVTQLALDIDPPIRPPVDGRTTSLTDVTDGNKPLLQPPGRAYSAAQVQVYLLAGLSEVFDRPLLTR